jgi:hypothetical protein
MTREEAEQHYPGAVDAVMLHEGQGHPLAPLLKKILDSERVRRLSPDEVLDGLRRSADQSLRVFPNGPLTKVRPQMDHPDFLKYLRGRLGAM